MRIKTIRILLLIFMASFFVFPTFAFEEYAEKTGAKCEVCHVDPAGGGDLTNLGKGYQLSVDPEAVLVATPAKSAPRIIKAVFGYIHIITALMWFGTILYVHLVLKPAYASKGLPRGEVRVGLVSMAIMALSGSVLTYYRVPSLEHLVSTRFGILLLVKIGLFATMVISALFVVLVIGPRLKRKRILNPVSSGEFSLADLADYDGEEGRPAYFGYQGKVYDVSQSSYWRNGRHMQRHHSGTDLTEMLPQAPHDEDRILAMHVVGQLVKQSADPPVEGPQRVFYFMAYLNLGFVFIIPLIIALWRWF